MAICRGCGLSDVVDGQACAGCGQVLHVVGDRDDLLRAVMQWAERHSGVVGSAGWDDLHASAYRAGYINVTSGWVGVGTELAGSCRSCRGVSPLCAACQALVQPHVCVPTPVVPECHPIYVIEADDERAGFIVPFFESEIFSDREAGPDELAMLRDVRSLTPLVLGQVMIDQDLVISDAGATSGGPHVVASLPISQSPTPFVLVAWLAKFGDEPTPIALGIYREKARDLVLSQAPAAPPEFQQLWLGADDRSVSDSSDLAARSLFFASIATYVVNTEQDETDVPRGIGAIVAALPHLDRYSTELGNDSDTAREIVLGRSGLEERIQDFNELVNNSTDDEVAASVVIAQVRGLGLVTQRSWDAALKEYQSALVSLPIEAKEARSQLSQRVLECLCVAGRMDAAEGHIAAEAHHDEEFALGVWVLCQRRLAHGDVRTAKQWAEWALGQLSQRAKPWGDSDEDVVERDMLDRAHSRLNSIMALIAFQEGDVPAAKTRLADGLQVDDTRTGSPLRLYPDILILRARLATHDGDLDTAQLVNTELVERFPLHPAALAMTNGHPIFPPPADDAALEGITWAYATRLFNLRGPVSHWWTACGPTVRIAGVPAPLEFGLLEDGTWHINSVFQPVGFDQFAQTLGLGATQIRMDEPCALRDRVGRLLNSVGADLGTFRLENGRSGLAGPWGTDRGTRIVHIAEFWRTQDGREVCLWSTLAYAAHEVIPVADRLRMDALVGTMLQQAAYAAENPMRSGVFTKLMDWPRSLVFTDVPETLIPRPRVLVAYDDTLPSAQESNDTMTSVPQTYSFGYEISDALNDEQLRTSLKVCVDAVTAVASLLESGRDRSVNGPDGRPLPTTETFVDEHRRLTVAIARSSSDERGGSKDDDDSFDRPPFNSRRPGWSTGLDEMDFRLTIPDTAGSFPLMDMLAQTDLMAGLKRRDPQSLAVVEQWEREGQVNVMGAMGVAMAIMGGDPEYGVALVRRSAELGNVYGWSNLGGLLGKHLTREERRTAFENGARSQLSVCAEFLAIMSAEDGDDKAALTWLTRAAQWGSSGATERLANIVDNEAEAEMLRRVAATQKREQVEQFPADDVGKRPVVGDEVEEYFNWSTALEVLTSEAVNIWWQEYGPSTRRLGEPDEAYAPGNAKWLVNSVMSLDRSALGPSPIGDEGEYDYIDLEFVDSPLARRVTAAAVQRGLQLKQGVDPSNHEGLSGLWVLGDGGRLVQFGVFHRHREHPEREIVQWQYQALATPEHLGAFGTLDVVSAGESIFTALAYMGESQGGQKITRETAWLETPHTLRPRPFVELRDGEFVPIFPTNVQSGMEIELSSIYCGAVLSFGYLIDSRLSDTQLADAFGRVVDCLTWSATTLRSAEPASGEGPLLSEQRFAQKWMQMARVNNGPDGIAMGLGFQLSPELRVVSRLKQTDQLWNFVTDQEARQFDIPGYSRESYEVLDQGLNRFREGDQREAIALMQKAASMGNGDAMDMLGLEAEERGDEKAALEWYRRSAMVGSRHGMGNHAVALESEGEQGQVQLGLLLAGGLLGQPIHRRNFAKRRELIEPKYGDRDFLQSSILLYVIAKSMEQELGGSTTVAIHDRAASLGHVSALGSLTWWALLNGRIEFGLSRYDKYAPLCCVRPPSVLLQPDWEYELVNTRSNYAFLRLAAGYDPAESLAIWNLGAPFGHTESILAPAVVAARSGDQGRAESVVSSMDERLLTDSRRLAEQMQAAQGWVSNFGRDALALLDTQKKGLFGRLRRGSESSGTTLGPFLTAEERVEQTFSAIRRAGEVSDRATNMIHSGDVKGGESLGMTLIESDADAVMRATIGNTIAFSVLIPQRRYDEAVALLEQLITWNVGRQSENARCNLGIVRYQQGDLPTARRLFMEVVSKWTGPVDEAHFYLWRIARDTDQPQTAREYAHDLREHFPSSEYISQLDDPPETSTGNSAKPTPSQPGSSGGGLTKSGPTGLRGSS